MPALHDSRALLAFLVTIGVGALFIGEPRAADPADPPAKSETKDEAKSETKDEAKSETKDEPTAESKPKPAPKKPITPPKKPADTTRPTKRPPDREVGQTLYKQSCWQCHGEKGAGDGPAAAALVGGVPTLAGRIRSKDAETLEDFDALIASVQNGKGRMPAYSEDIDKSDTRRILLYVRDQLEGKVTGGGQGDEGEGEGDADGPGGGQ